MSKKIIIVDDSNVIHIQVETVLQELINSGKVTLKSYLDPTELIGALRAGVEDFDLLISDINMPQMNGLDVARSVKAMPQFAKKPMFILTTETDENLISKAKELALTGWLVKPPKQPKFTKAIMMALQIH